MDLFPLSFHRAQGVEAPGQDSSPEGSVEGGWFQRQRGLHLGRHSEARTCVSAETNRSCASHVHSQAWLAPSPEARTVTGKHEITKAPGVRHKQNVTNGSAVDSLHLNFGP